ncbi:hypothetical protein Marpi_0419 [Marinitoga piezophila KA3]|uniref:Ankyrin repeat-containing protein n=1 Tax=Marinitoga piezophila (strain DSM 14283 / JCM 11233 / KA3) TaxID=443254 RepID=H2J4S8_MARPK|nr:hypothetical protein [Marinitoga piezophila]AEX84863.1 hypothetical protein Marpi_0419 [Marinitoga piezophila KA3]
MDEKIIFSILNHENDIIYKKYLNNEFLFGESIETTITPLHAAIISDNIEVIKLMEKSGYNIVYALLNNNDILNPYILAKRLDREEIVEYFDEILEQNLNTDLKNTENFKYIEIEKVFEDILKDAENKQKIQEFLEKFLKHPKNLLLETNIAKRIFCEIPNEELVFFIKKIIDVLTDEYCSMFLYEFLDPKCKLASVYALIRIKESQNIAVYYNEKYINRLIDIYDIFMLNDDEDKITYLETINRFYIEELSEDIKDLFFETQNDKLKYITYKILLKYELEELFEITKEAMKSNYLPLKELATLICILKYENNCKKQDNIKFENLREEDYIAISLFDTPYVEDIIYKKFSTFSYDTKLNIIHNLIIISSKRRYNMLLDIYKFEKNPEIKAEIIYQFIIREIYTPEILKVFIEDFIKNLDEYNSYDDNEDFNIFSALGHYFANILMKKELF